MSAVSTEEFVLWYDSLSIDQIPEVGGKNASLGELIQNLKAEGINVPDGFATTSEAYRHFLRANKLDIKIGEIINDYKQGTRNLKDVGRKIRSMIVDAPIPDDLERVILKSYARLSAKYDEEKTDVAVRSSATAEDLPDASFAGQQESFLNIHGELELLSACRKCYASLFTDRAISYRTTKGFDHMSVALSIGIQKMVRSDKSCAGVLFTIDTESGYPDVIVINGAYGLGECVVQGMVTPDEFRIYKPLLGKSRFPVIKKELGSKLEKMVYSTGARHPTKIIETTELERKRFVLKDDEILKLGHWAKAIEAHYQRPMDVEWAKDGATGELFIVQARPETVQSRTKQNVMEEYTLKTSGPLITSGLAVGNKIAGGEAIVIEHAKDLHKFQEGQILVTTITDPDWVPIMQKAKGIVTDHGGRTSHAAIVSRELGIPAVTGCGNATQIIKSGQQLTIDCASGDNGFVYEGILEFDTRQVDIDHLPETKTKIMINMANPKACFNWWKLPVDGIGLARMEFIITDQIKVHPMALIEFDKITDLQTQKQIEELTLGYTDKSDFFVDQLSQGIASLAASVYPNPIILRMSDFKTNEYAGLIGGAGFEPNEENPMLGFRGASRYYSDKYKAGFALECKAIKKAREDMGFDNLYIMVPFLRTLGEAEKITQVLAENGLKRGENNLNIYVMCEIPANVILADRFSEFFDGFSIGSNDLTQLTLGIDRDSDELTYLFDERDPAVKEMISMVIAKAHTKGRKVGICGQAPSDHEGFAEFLVDQGIDSISVNPDKFVEVKMRVAAQEKKGS